MRAAVTTSALLELSRALNQATTLALAMDQVLVSIEQHTRYRRAWLLLPMSKDRGLEVVGYALPDRAQVQQRMADIDISGDPWMRFHLEASEPMVRDDLREEPLADQRQVEHFGNRTLISVPMLRVAERIGAFCVGTFAAEGVLPPTPEEIEFIVQVGALISVVAGRIRAEQSQRELEDRMRGTQRLEALGRMAGEIAHDFNNMLVSILGNADVAKEMLGNHPARELVEEVEQAAVRAARLTRQLLSFSRGQPLQRREVELNAVVNHFRSMLESLLPANIELHISHDSNPSVVLADASQLEQVILNLVVNARDALPHGGQIRLSTEARHVDGAYAETRVGAHVGDYVLLSVSDTGVGMAPEVRARLFEPFFTTKALGAGTGLGLAVVETVLKRHDGFIDVSSEPNQGTTFRIFFPAIQASASALAAVKPRESDTDLRGSEVVLVVDDDRQVRSLLERVLGQAGYTVLLAEDGQAALDVLAGRADVALVISDLVMPRLGGDELRDRLRADPDAPPVLIMSGYARGSAAQDSFEYLLSKPFTPRDLLRKVRAVLRASRRSSTAPAA